MSVERLEGAPAIQFETACRVRELPRWLGSTYTRLVTTRPPMTCDSAEFALGAWMCQIAVQPSGRTGPSLTETGDGLRISESSDPRCGDRTLPQTFHWKYRMSLVRR